MDGYSAEGMMKLLEVKITVKVSDGSEPWNTCSDDEFERRLLHVQSAIASRVSLLKAEFNDLDFEENYSEVW